MFTITGEVKGGEVTVNIGVILVEMSIDSGASANVIGQAKWEQLKKRHIKCVSKRSTKKLYDYEAVTPLEVIDTITEEITLESKCVPAEFTAVKGQGEPLLRRESTTELAVLKLQVPVHHVTDYSELTARYKDVFKGIGIGRTTTGRHH